MARILCAYSGIAFKCEHFPLFFDERQCYHPIFTLSNEQLLNTVYTRWLKEELNNTESYMLYLALFNCTSLVEFRVPAIRTPQTDSIVATNMEKLVAMVENITDIGTYKAKECLQLPQFVISPETKDLSNTKYWIEIWAANWKDYKSRYKLTHHTQELRRLENSLEGFIKDASKDIKTYSAKLANWVAIAANFPNCTCIRPANEKQFSCIAEYWKYIIRVAASNNSISDEDVLDKILAHCDEYLEPGSIYSYLIYKILNEAKKKSNDFFYICDMDFSPATLKDENNIIQNPNGSTSYITKASVTSEIERIELNKTLSKAPENEPKKSDYKSFAEYVKAKLAWGILASTKSPN